MDVLIDVGSTDVRELWFASEPELEDVLEATSERSMDGPVVWGMEIAGVGRHSGYSSSKR